jgi:RNA polymerase sigma-70 factor (ECF subfamily)
MSSTLQAPRHAQASRSLSASDKLFSTASPEPATYEWKRTLNEAELETSKAAAASTAESGLATDEELIERARRGEANAFGDLIQRYYSTCLMRALSIMHDDDDAKDEVQNACWKAYQRLPQFQGTGTFPAWLNRIVENQCLMRLRRERRSCIVHPRESTEESERQIDFVDQSPGPEDALGNREVENLVRTEVGRIPLPLRKVVQLCDLQQLPIAHVAVCLGLTVPATKSRLLRARAELRSRLTKHCGRRKHGTLTRRSTHANVVRTYAG